MNYKCFNKVTNTLKHTQSIKLSCPKNVVKMYFKLLFRNSPKRTEILPVYISLKRKKMYLQIASLMPYYN